MRNIIYLAGAISGISWEEASGWRDAIADNLFKVSHGEWKCFDPCEHYNEYGEVINDSESMKYDLDHLRHSRFVIANFNYTQKSIGTLIEIGVALENKIPVIGYYSEKEPLHPWILSACIHVCTSESGLYQFLTDHYLNEV